MAKVERHCCYLPLKTLEDNKEIQEVTVSLISAKETIVDATVTVVLSIPGFPKWKLCFALPLTGLGKSLIEAHHTVVTRI